MCRWKDGENIKINLLAWIDPTKSVLTKFFPLILLSEAILNVNNQGKLMNTFEEYKNLEQDNWNADMGKCHKN